jgi:hypothetical protein
MGAIEKMSAPVEVKRNKKPHRYLMRLYVVLTKIYQ